VSAPVEKIKAPAWLRRLPDPWRGRLKALHAAWHHGVAAFQMFSEVYDRYGSYVELEVHLNAEVFAVESRP